MEIVNKVADSGIVTLDLAPFVPEENEVIFFDLKPFLFREMILKEKDFRESMKNHDWQLYSGKAVAIGCSVDAIIPVWAFMLVTTYLQGIAAHVFFGSQKELVSHLSFQRINEMELEDFMDKRVVLKGCGDKHVPEAVYVAASHKLLPVVKSLMYGEPCSTVPVYKKKIVRVG